MGNPEVPKTTVRLVRWIRRLGPFWLDHGFGGEPLDLFRISIRWRAAAHEPLHLIRRRWNRSSGRSLPPAAPRPAPHSIGANPGTDQRPTRRFESLRCVSESLAIRRRGLRRTPPRFRGGGTLVLL